MINTLSPDQCRMFSARLMELANLSYTALVIGQMLSQQVKLRAMVFGLMLLIAGYAVALAVVKGGDA